MLAKPVVDAGCFFLGFRTVVPQMANISTDFTLHVWAHGLDSAFGELGGMVVQPLYSAVYFCNKQSRLLHGIHAVLCFTSFSPTLVCHNLFDECGGILDGEGEECPSSCGVKVLHWYGCQAHIKVLEHKPIFHSMVGTGSDKVLQPFPCFRDGLEWCLLEVGYLPL